MKKLIAITSISLSFGFAIALVNANDQKVEKTEKSSVTTSSTVMGDENSQQPGTSMEQSPNSNTSSDKTQPAGTGMTNTTTQETTKSTAKSQASTCTDSTGNVLHSGDSGFSTCVNAMKKNKKSHQMGGEASSSYSSGSPTDSSSDSSSDSMRDPE